MTNLKEIEKVANEYGNDLAKVKKAIKAVQSARCILKKNKFTANYDEKMNELLRRQQVLCEVRSMLEPKKKTVTTFEQSDVDKLDYDETVKALRSIQSKKTHTKYLESNAGGEPGANDEYRAACKIEQMLLEHKAKLQPVEATAVRKTDVAAVIDEIENQNLSQERIAELLKKLL